MKLRSFTGILWQLPSWRSHQTSSNPESDDSKSAALESGDSDAKRTLAPGLDTLNGSSTLPSEKSAGDGEVTPAPSNLVEPSSPAIAMAA